MEFVALDARCEALAVREIKIGEFSPAGGGFFSFSDATPDNPQTGVTQSALDEKFSFAQDSRAQNLDKPSAGRSCSRNFRGVPKSERIASAAR